MAHRFRHTFSSWYLVRHPGDETGLRGILGHLSADMLRVYVHLAYEITAQRAGRVSLSEAWLGARDGEQQPRRSEHARTEGGTSDQADVQQLHSAIQSNPKLARALLQALEETQQ
jgi:hypothetical protein